MGELILNGVSYGAKTPPELITNAQIYSLEEKQVGVWVDEKPLYQKTVIINNITSLSASYTLNISNFDIVDIKTIWKRGRLNRWSTLDTVSEAKYSQYRTYWQIDNDGTMSLEFTNFPLSDIQISYAYVTILYTKTTDSAGSGGYQAYGFSPIIYSEEEREVGVWVDNKPLYQKSIYAGNLNGQRISIPLNIQDVERIWYTSGSLFEDGNTIAYVTGTDSRNNLGGFFNNLGSGNSATFELRGGSNYGDIRNFTLTVQYTKTTDVAGSGSYNTLGVPTIHYTTDEQVIGTWTDGKPLYQKTLKSNSGIARNSWVSIINDSSIRIKKYYGYIYYSDNLEDGIKYPLDWTRVANGAYSCSECNGGDLEVIQNIATSYGYDVTLQYTKTTD